MGGAKVEALIVWVKAQGAKDATLFPKLYAQADPYAWAHTQMEESQLGEVLYGRPSKQPELSRTATKKVQIPSTVCGCPHAGIR